MNRKFCVCTVLALFFCGAVLSVAMRSTAQAADWPGFRGPGAQGHADVKKLPLKWSNTQGIGWQTKLPGSGWSSPVLVDGKLYLTGAEIEENKAMKLAVYSFDAKSGKNLWRRELFVIRGKTPRVHKKNSHASPTPTIEDGRLYVHFGTHGTACLDLSGKVIWKKNDIKYPPVHGGGCSPVIVNDLVFFSCDGSRDPFVMALNKNTGKVAWKVARTGDPKRKFSFCTPLVIEVAGMKQIISPGSGAVVAYDVKGKTLWKVRYGEGYSVVPRPVYGHGLLYLSSGFDKAVMYAIKPGDGMTTKGDITKTAVKWTLTKGAPHTPSPLLVGNELYIVSDGGIASCLDAKTGELNWKQRLGGQYSASPLHWNGHVYCQSETGETVIFKAGKKYQEVARNKLKGSTLASYGIGEGAIYLRTDTQLFRIGTGK